MPCFRMLIVLCALIFGSLHVHAQNTGIEGTVIDKDSLGHPVANATILVKDSSNSVIASSVTNSEGRYTISPLAVAKYAIEIRYQRDSSRVNDIRVSNGYFTIVDIWLHSVKKHYEPPWFSKKYPGSSYTTTSEQIMHR